MIDWKMFTIAWCVKPSTQMSFTYTSTSPIFSCPSNQAGPFGTIDLICRNSSTLSSPPTMVKPSPRIDFTSVVISRSPRKFAGFLVKWLTRPPLPPPGPGPPPSPFPSTVCIVEELPRSCSRFACRTGFSYCRTQSVLILQLMGREVSFLVVEATRFAVTGRDRHATIVALLLLLHLMMMVEVMMMMQKLQKM
uniref:Uncharacterized protein n=1 Tax=Anopheles farauti TaxID=69004 RepID=A0A182Q6A1_9DIPT